jgi:ABC-2 type transport system permease protein
MQWDPLDLLGVLAVIVLGAAFFSTFSVIIASLLRTRDRVMGIGQLLTMPLFFASNAIYPIDLMPGWLRVISSANPLTYEVDALRTLMIRDWPSSYGVGVDFAVLLTVTLLLVAIGARLYPRVLV